MIATEPPSLFRLQPTVLRGRVVDAATRAPIPGVAVCASQVQAQADAQERYRLARIVHGAGVIGRALYCQEGTPLRYDMSTMSRR